MSDEKVNEVEEHEEVDARLDEADVSQREMYEPEPEEDFEPEPQEQKQDDDWRLRAMQDPRVRERFDQALFGNQEQSPYEAPPDPVEQARSKLNELDSSMPELDPNNVTAEQVTKFMQWQNERARAAQEFADARLQRQEQQLMAQSARTELEDYIQSTKQADPDFKNYESKFRTFVRENNIDPRLLKNRQVIEMIRKSIGYDEMKGRRKAKAPGAPPVDESYTSQGQRQRQAKRDAQPKLREATELDEQLAAYYRIPVEELIASEQELGGDRERWTMKDAVQWSDPEKLRRAGFRR